MVQYCKTALKSKRKTPPPIQSLRSLNESTHFEDTEGEGSTLEGLTRAQ